MQSGANERRAERSWRARCAGFASAPAPSGPGAVLRLAAPLRSPLAVRRRRRSSRRRSATRRTTARSPTLMPPSDDSLTRLESAGLFGRTPSSSSADHGESLGEHGERTHGTFLYDATIRVPLIVKIPGEEAVLQDRVGHRAGRDRRPGADDCRARCSHACHAARATGWHRPPPADAGHDLPGRGPRRTAQTVYAESYYQNVLLGWSPLRAVRGPDWKLIDAPAPELYDLEGPRRDRERHSRSSKRRPGLRLRACRRRQKRSRRGRRPRARSASAASGTSAEKRFAVRRMGPIRRTRSPSGTRSSTGSISSPAILEAAHASLAEALRLDPANGLAMKYLADLSFRAKRFDEATRRLSASPCGRIPPRRRLRQPRGDRRARGRPD